MFTDEHPVEETTTDVLSGTGPMLLGVLVQSEEVLSDAHCRNLFDACSPYIEISYEDFKPDFMNWLHRFGRGEIGPDFLPLLPAQKRLQVNDA